MAAGRVAKAQRRPRRTQPPPTPTGAKRYRFTPELFEQLGELGLFRDQRVELIGGEIVQMAPVGPEHGSTVDQTMLSFGQRLPAKNYYLRIQNPLRLGDSEPFPDIAIVPGKPSDYRQHHPTTALLVIEIADTSLEYDRTEKMSLYASAGIPEYWIVNLVERCLEVYREPVSPAEGTAFNARYKWLRYYSLEETVEPLFEPGLVIPVRALFEGEA
jgi:Uma2 family endonuclease